MGMLETHENRNTSNARRIDTHAHLVPDFYRRWLADKGADAGGLPIPDWSVQSTLQFMQANDIETSILSVATPGAEPGEFNEARQMARRLNEFAATVVSENPRRFGFLATLMLPDVDGSLAEAAYVLDHLHADGVILHANSRGIYLGDPKFDPLMDELNRREAVIFVHPSELAGNTVPGIPAYVADFLLDSIRAAINLSHTGIMDRCRNLKVILSHAGGFLPYSASRLSMHASPKSSLEDGLGILRRFYFDTALASTKFSMPSLLAFADPTHITYGSDFPYAPSAISCMFTKELDADSDADHYATDRGNAAQLFPRFADNA
jgi:predicted TIM-barrel fold metal-dependent hydrolase